MINEEYSQLVRMLASRTSEGSVNWKATIADNEFVVLFQNFSLSIRAEAENWEPTSYRLTLRNGLGKEIDELYVGSGAELYETVHDLYSSARRKALHIDEALQLILGELKSADLVGLDEPPLENKIPLEPFDDDIPF
jgi:hypothetical protein